MDREKSSQESFIGSFFHSFLYHTSFSCDDYNCFNINNYKIFGFYFNAYLTRLWPVGHQEFPMNVIYVFFQLEIKGRVK